MRSPGLALTSAARVRRAHRTRRSWRVGHYQPWRTAAHCTRPEPRHLLQSESEDTRKNWGTLYWTSIFECVLDTSIEAPKAGGPFGRSSLGAKGELLQFHLDAG